MVPSFGGSYNGLKKVCSSLFGRGGLLKIGRICESWDVGFLPLPASSAKSRAEYGFVKGRNVQLNEKHAFHKLRKL